MATGQDARDGDDCVHDAHDDIVDFPRNTRDEPHGHPMNVEMETASRAIKSEVLDP
jgi:hypothetical protein